MKITKVQIRHFRAFRGEYDIDLGDGRNLLVYGENGSGKSSMYQALNMFFAPATPFEHYKNIFVTTDDGFVKLEIGDGTNPPQTYEWEQTSHPYTQVIIAEAAKTKGFLDYRALLETHFVHRQDDNVNVFDLMVKSLLVNVENPITRVILADEWNAIRQVLSRRRSHRRDERLAQLLSDFNMGLTALLVDLTDKASTILSVFEQDVSIQLALPDAGLTLNADAKAIERSVIALKVDYYGTTIPAHHRFLNEARLTAMAISVYLGALLLNPPSQLRVLFLDDVLIGLDMSNRLPLLDILDQYFQDWQIVLTTHDRVWFEMVRMRVENRTPRWEIAEFFCEKTPDGDLPVYHQTKDYLGMAQGHLTRNDLKAAAIYIRSAYELVIKHFCNRHNLAIRYCQNPKEQKSDDFWQVVKSLKLRTTGADVLTPSLISDIELYRATVLNQLSHTAPINLVRVEVESAYTAVDQLRTTLAGIAKGSLA